MFMTIPKVIVGQLDLTDTRAGHVEEAYSIVRSAYGSTALAMPKWTYGLLPTLKGTASDIAANVVSNLLSNPEISFPTALIDCRSATMLDGPAPTYRLVAGCNLQRVKCWSLSGLGGNEVGEAMLQIGALGLPATVVSAVQKIQHPDTRNIVDSYPLGDAGAAILVSMRRPSKGFTWRICGCAVAQLKLGELPEPNHFRMLVAEACQSGGVPFTAIRWCVAQHLSAAFVSSVEAAFSQQTCNSPTRTHHEVNFGCADVFVSLAQSANELAGMGVLVFGGRFGSIGLVLLDD